MLITVPSELPGVQVKRHTVIFQWEKVLFVVEVVILSADILCDNCDNINWYS